jgi:hypothetical protein
MDLSKTYQAMTLVEIDKFISDQQEEHLQLEFKTVADSNFTVRENRKNLAKCLSGFGNSAGGIIVWGIDARRNAASIDCASQKTPITQLSGVLSSLNQYTGSCVSPIVEGVVHRSIEIATDEGFVVTLIPESDAGPHMAKGGEDRYYKRSGAAFYRMEHFDIEDMFGRRKKPKLDVSLQVAHVSTDNSGRSGCYDAKISMEIRNSGRGVAKCPYLEIFLAKPWKLSPYGLSRNRTGLLEVNSARAVEIRCFGGDTNTAIHPGTSLPVHVIEVKFERDTKELADLVLDYKVAAEDLRIQAGRVCIPGDRLIEMVKQWSPPVHLS